jgi:LacI family transcriptional regulator
MQSSWVAVDDEQGAYEATSHLIEQGYQRIAHLMGPEKLTLSHNRFKGYQKALNEHGIVIDDALVLKGNYSTKEEGEHIITEALNAPNPPDAVFAHTDITAFGAIAAAKRKGLQVPHDFGVVGFSDWQFSELISPSLSSVIQPGYEMGRQAANIFLHESAEKEKAHPQNIVLKTELVVRESSRRK